MRKEPTIITIPARSGDPLVLANQLVEMGVPVFSTPLNSAGAPKREGWQNTVPDARELSKWRPGMGLGVLTGELFDVLDVDPRNGGSKSLRSLLRLLGDNAPDYFLKVRTPSGGWHFYIAPLGLGKHAGFLPGLDLLGDKAFAFLPPTVRKGGSYVAEKVVPGLSGLYSAEPCEALRALVSAHLEEREVAGTELGSNRPEIEALKRAVLNAPDGGQYGALLSLTHEWQKRYEQETVKEMLRLFLPTIPLIDKNNPWYPAKGKGRRADHWVNHFMHKKGRIIPDASAAERKVLEGVRPQRDTSKLLAGMRTGKWLDEQEFKPLVFAVPSLIPAGFTICSGAPFSGKSILVLRMGLEVARGGKVFGVKVTRRPVFYLALEDSDRRMQERVRELLGPGVAVPRGFSYQTEVLPGKLTATVAAWLSRAGHEHGMVLVDTLGKVLDRPQKGETTYDRDYRLVGNIKAICAEYPDSTIIANHHNRKAVGPDIFDMVSGTNAITGVADTVLVIERKRGEPEGVLNLISRDLDEARYAMTLARPTGWTMPEDSLGAAADLAAVQPRRAESLSSKTLKIVELVCSRPNGISAEEVSAEIEITIADARTRLNRSTTKGEIRRISRGIFGPPRKAKIGGEDK